MSFYSQEDAEYEFNARYDYMHEAYAATKLDPWHEGYCDYCFECREYSEEALDFDAWKAEQMKPRKVASPVAYSDEIPF